MSVLEDLKRVILWVRELKYRIAADKHHLYREQEEVMWLLHEVLKSLDGVQVRIQSAPVQEVRVSQPVP